MMGKRSVGRGWWSVRPYGQYHACTHDFCNFYCNQDSRVYSTILYYHNKKNMSKKYLPLRTPMPPLRCRSNATATAAAALTPLPPR